MCSRSSEKLIYKSVKSGSDAFNDLDLEILRIYNPELVKVMRDSGDTCFWTIKTLDHIMLHQNGIRNIHEQEFELDICKECNSSLTNKSMPRLALANGLYRGSLPEEFNDMTWIEEMVCAKHLTTAMVTRLSMGHGVFKSRKLRGNTCAHEMNMVSTAKALPRAPTDINDMLSVVFLGPQKLDEAKLKTIFYVRRQKVWRFLMWLKEHNELYSDIDIDPTAIRQYPEDGVLPGISERVIFNKTQTASDIYDEETAGMSEHASSLMFDQNSAPDEDDSDLFIEKCGVSDADSVSIPGRFPVASGLRNLVRQRSAKTEVGLEIHKGPRPLAEYNNSSLIPGMYPTLYPYGIGGFEIRKRPTKLSFKAQANYYLDITDRKFRYHHSFIFVVLNIIQRREGHLQTSFTVKRSNFDQVARAINETSADSIRKLAETIEKEGHPKRLTSEEQKVFSMLKHVNTIATKVPGSSASKTLCRNEIRSYVGVMGVPQIFLTINPSPQHHPVFMMMYGDQTVNLNERYPDIVPGPERAKRLAHDPVAAADFFDRSIRLIFQHLFGWDFENGRSSEKGGILGVLKGFYGSAEYTERGVLHGHFLLWLEGGLNPTEVHDRMKKDVNFQERFFDFFESIIKHELPNVDVPPGFDGKKYTPATEMPPPPLRPLNKSESEWDEDEFDAWHSCLDNEVRMCGEALQRHSCKSVCHKYGNGGRCRFRFPHPTVEASYFDAENNSVMLKVQDAWLNYYNPYLLTYCRHNHDIRCILSGKSAKAAMFYITDYITKMSLKTSQILSLMCDAVMQSPKCEDATEVEKAKALLHKCLTQFSRKQQINAQQAARYLRGLNDSISSHRTSPVLSQLAFLYIKTKYDARNVEGDIQCNESEDGSTDTSVSRDLDEEDSDSPFDILFEDEHDTSTTQTEIGNGGGHGVVPPEDNSRAAQAGVSAGGQEFESVKLKVELTDNGKVVSYTQLDNYLY